MTDDIRFRDKPKRTARVKLFFGDAEHDFILKFDQLEELQDKLEQGPMRTLMNFESTDWSPKSVFEVIRLGLIGGGKTPAEAFALAKRYCVERPLGESLPVAGAVLSAALVGVEVENEEAVDG